MRVLGIDPGSRLTGWGVVEERGLGLRHVASGTIALGSRATAAVRLARLHAECVRLMGRWTPAAVAVERAFVARNPQSALRLGEARGAVLAAVATAESALHEYTPAEVKLATVGHGAADKSAIRRAVVARLGVGPRLSFDAADALAVALCHLDRAPLARRIATALARERVPGRGRTPRSGASAGQAVRVDRNAAAPEETPAERRKCGPDASCVPGRDSGGRDVPERRSRGGWS